MLNFFKTIGNKIKNFGIGKAISALDNFQGPLAAKIEESKQKINQLDSKGMAAWIIDTVQDHLYTYAGIPNPEKKK